MSVSKGGPILTLEPLIDAIRSGVEGAGWELSGLQKTTSHQFEGRWEGDSTRSAYLFFHVPDGPEFASVDVYLDETSRGLTGNLALVVDLVSLGGLGGIRDVLAALATASAREIAAERRRPLTLRFRMGDVDREVATAETEVRFKVRLDRDVIHSGPAGVTDLAAVVMAAFSRILQSPEVTVLADHDE